MTFTSIFEKIWENPSRLPWKAEAHWLPTRQYLIRTVFLLLFATGNLSGEATGTMRTAVDTPLIVRSCSDFKINGLGNNSQWEKTTWTDLKKLDKAGKPYGSRFKVLYSQKGIYVLFNGEDEKITSPFTNDFDKIFRADVFEVFFHSNPAEPFYFEYEVSPLEKELVLLIVNRNGKFGGWAPWPYEEGNRVEKKVIVSGGKTEDGAVIKSWTAELFFPYRLLSVFDKVPPASGTRWKANFCRLDYDSGTMVKWAWAPVKTSFHEFQQYYSLKFE